MVAQNRNKIIDFSMVGKNFLVHSGKGFYLVSVSKEIVGFCFGFFVPTRKN